MRKRKTQAELLSAQSSQFQAKIPCVLTVVHQASSIQTKVLNRQCQSKGYVALNLPRPKPDESIEITTDRIEKFLSENRNYQVKFVIVEGNYSCFASPNPNYPLLRYLLQLVRSPSNIIVTTNTAECIKNILEHPDFSKVVNYQITGALNTALEAKEEKDSCCKRWCVLL